MFFLSGVQRGPHETHSHNHNQTGRPPSNSWLVARSPVFCQHAHKHKHSDPPSRVVPKCQPASLPLSQNAGVAIAANIPGSHSNNLEENARTLAAQKPLSIGGHPRRKQADNVESQAETLSVGCDHIAHGERTWGQAIKKVSFIITLTKTAWKSCGKVSGKSKKLACYKMVVAVRSHGDWAMIVFVPGGYVDIFLFSPNHNCLCK